MTRQTNSGTPWSLHLDRDGTEDFLIICDPEGNDIVRSEFFWQPEEEDEPLPKTMAAVWLMFKAPRLLGALQALAEVANHDCPAQARSCFFIEALEHANAVIAEAMARPPYIRRSGPGLPASAAGNGSMTAPIDIHAALADRRQIAAIWSIEDVQAVRPDLTDDEAWQVLQEVNRRMDAELGINWQTLENYSDVLFGVTPQADDD